MPTYSKNKSAVFCKTKDKYGAYSNMCAGYPLELNGYKIRTSEALYQALKFPDNVSIQKEIIEAKSPMMAKICSREHQDLARSNWDDIRVEVMEWCVKLKLVQNWDKFSAALLESGSMPIVEFSRKDSFWGATEDSIGMLSGQNILGKILTTVREKLTTYSTSLEIVNPLNIENFSFMGERINTQRRPS